MFFCPDCHVSNRVDAKFCRKCGKSRSDLERANVNAAVSEETAIQTQQFVSGQNIQVESTVAEEVVVAALDTAYGVGENVEILEQQQEQQQQQPQPQCPSCWETLRATDKFCCWCGEAQPNRVLPFMKLCLECNTFLPEKANYCYACGTDVGYSSRRKVRLPVELFKDEDSEFFPRFDA